MKTLLNQAELSFKTILTYIVVFFEYLLPTGVSIAVDEK